MPDFPSTEWFNEVGRVANESGVIRSFGTCDVDFGVQVGDRYFQLSFEAFDFMGAREIDEERAWELDFVLVQEPGAWREMLESTSGHGSADLKHTLNTLDLGSEEEFARARDYLRRDKFYRFNQTLQAYFDSSAEIETQFAEAVAT